MVAGSPPYPQFWSTGSHDCQKRRQTITLLLANHYHLDHTILQVVTYHVFLS